jgi:glucosylceramidase
MTYNHDLPLRNDEVRVYQTSQEHSDQLKLMTSADFQERGFDLVELIFRDDSSENPQVSFGDMSHAEVSFDPAVKYQSVIGFGGAFTEASAVNFFKLPVPQREKFLEAYFGESGIGYSVGRISIGSCDFSLGSYSFDDVEGDYEVCTPALSCFPLT